MPVACRRRSANAFPTGLVEILFRSTLRAIEAVALSMAWPWGLKGRDFLELLRIVIDTHIIEMPKRAGDNVQRGRVGTTASPMRLAAEEACVGLDRAGRVSGRVRRGRALEPNARTHSRQPGLV